MTTDTLSLHATATSVLEVEVQLRELWKRSDAVAGHTIIRARSLNLVVYTDSEEERERVAETLRTLVQAHPSRSIILCAHRGHEETGFEADITTECRKIGDNLLCYEQVCVNASGPIARHLAAVVEPLLTSHLPTYLWWNGIPPMSQENFRDLLAICDRLIVDSHRFSGGARDLARLADFARKSSIPVTDLNWQRLTPWRELIAQFFIGQCDVAHLAGIERVEVGYGAGPGTQPLLLLGWLGSRLGWKVEGEELRNSRGRPLQLKVDGVSGREGEILGIELQTEVTGGSGHFAIRRDDHNVEMRMKGAGVPDLTNTTLLDRPSEAELLQGEICVRSRDTIYDAALEMAAKLAALSSEF